MLSSIIYKGGAILKVPAFMRSVSKFQMSKGKMEGLNHAIGEFTESVKL